MVQHGPTVSEAGNTFLGHVRGINTNPTDSVAFSDNDVAESDTK
jgi:hypothetical protein